MVLLLLLRDKLGQFGNSESGTYAFKLGLVKFGEILFEKYHMLKYSANVVFNDSLVNEAIHIV